jgi:hypothetical protein
VVRELTGAAPRRHGGRAFAVAVGVLLLVLAYVAFVPSVAVLALLAVFLLSGEGASTEGFDLMTLAVLAGTLALGVILWKLGLRLVRGGRHLALFLRKFGFTGASQAVSVAIGRGLGRTWRLVTLDDNDLAPIGVGGGSRWTVRLLRLALLAGAVALAVAAVRYVQSDSGQEIIDSTIESAVADAQATGGSELGATLGAIFVGAFVAAVLLVLVVGLLSVMIAVAATGGLLLTTVGRSARRAEKAKAIVVTDADQVDRGIARLRRRIRRVLAPRITVARVSDHLWQTVVRRLAAVSDAVIVDVSFPTGNLIWEISTLEGAGARWLPIGRLDRLQALAHDPSPEATELRRLLGRREVIGYHPGDLDAFSDGLRRSLELVEGRA